MTSLKSFNRRVGALFGVAALVLATVTPGLVPAFASAAQVTERSVELSSSSRQSTNVSYTISFKAATNGATSVALNFCGDTPLIGVSCATPAGFNVSAAQATGYTLSAANTPANNTIIATPAAAINQNDTVTIPLTGVTNPDNAGPLYVRIVTYDTDTHAKDYTPATLGAGVVDQGSAAASITESVGVSGAVLETMTFCVSGHVIDLAGCKTSEGPVLAAPTLKLGETSGDVVALDAAHVSEGSIYSQISTNAVSGAVVNLKSNAFGCGGLLRAGAPSACDILAAGNGGITAGQAKFGVKVASATGPTDDPTGNGAFQGANANAYYNASTFALNGDKTNQTGVTSPFGDTFLDTVSAPVSNKNVKITFGASVANNTPAGLYSADLSLIATGKF